MLSGMSVLIRIFRCEQVARAFVAANALAVIAVGGLISSALPAEGSVASSPAAGTSGLLASGLTNGSADVMCLSDYKNATASGTKVVLNPCAKSNESELWTPYSDGTIRIHSLCLTVTGTVNGSSMEISTCKGASDQIWETGSNPQVSLSVLQPKSVGKCLDVYGSKTADNAVVDIWACDDTDAQVWGWVTGSAAIAPGGSLANANCNYIGGFNEPNDGGCYAWVGGVQADNNNFSAAGVSVDFKQGNPTCADGCGHSIVEIMAADATGKNTIEYGWGVAANAAQPTLGIGLWANGQPLDALANFVRASTKVKIGQTVTVGATGTYGISFDSASQEWQLFYNGTEVGYFPQSIWSSRGTSYTAVGWDEIFGEVVQPALTVAHMEMGNAILGSSPGSASVSDYQLLDSSTAADFSSFFVDANSRFYDDGGTSSTGFSYGGPGIFGASSSSNRSRPAASPRARHIIRPPVGTLSF
jgi:hypothetical protein